MLEQGGPAALEDVDGLDPSLQMTLFVWHRCTRWNSLPGPGGILDQEERIMRLLDAIQDEVDAHKQEQDRLAMQRANNSHMMANLPPGSNVTTWRPRKR